MSSTTPIYTAPEAQAAAMEIEGVVDAYVLTEAGGAVALTAVVPPGTDLAAVKAELETAFEGRTALGASWTFEVLHGSGPDGPFR